MDGLGVLAGVLVGDVADFIGDKEQLNSRISALALAEGVSATTSPERNRQHHLERAGAKQFDANVERRQVGVLGEKNFLAAGHDGAQALETDSAIGKVILRKPA